MRKEAGLRAQHGSVCSTTKHSTTWLSDGRLVRKEERGKRRGLELSAKPSVGHGTIADLSDTNAFFRVDSEMHADRILPSAVLS